MSYKHILVAVDLSEESNYLVKKAVALAESLKAELSLIHIDENYNEHYIGLIDINLKTREYSEEFIAKLAEKTDYPLRNTFVGSGHLCDELCHTIREFNIDILVCGHHQDFVSKFSSSAKKIINRSPVDMLVVPIIKE
ncbi:universal stress protein [Vibrio marisflavi]|uniref:Universal stress protein n=1 Tax=Vibrio marisflavi CECT 7928 TaxID=634439 RepID=A0ABN8E8F4_9VIBR|nr:universal stress protein [Vibrio marisflavi]CAH0542754.1 Universal stress protein A [Vibrio marisflavi CECT 7928]